MCFTQYLLGKVTPPNFEVTGDQAMCFTQYLLGKETPLNFEVTGDQAMCFTQYLLVKESPPNFEVTGDQAMYFTQYLLGKGTPLNLSQVLCTSQRQVHQPVWALLWVLIWSQTLSTYHHLVREHCSNLHRVTTYVSVRGQEYCSPPLSHTCRVASVSGGASAARAPPPASLPLVHTPSVPPTPPSMHLLHNDPAPLLLMPPQQHQPLPHLPSPWYTPPQYPPHPPARTCSTMTRRLCFWCRRSRTSPATTSVGTTSRSRKNSVNSFATSANEPCTKTNRP